MHLDPLAAPQIRALLERLLEELEGDWLLVGGALAAIWFDDRRTTEDIDLVGLRGTPEERYSLLDRVCRLGLPVETVNSAADYFVHRIPDWRDQIEPLMQRGRASLYRPTPTLFLQLKSSRLSERDLEDCRLLLSWCARETQPVDTGRVRDHLARLPRGDGPGELARREALLGLLGGFPTP